jgi:hypothetical protein
MRFFSRLANRSTAKVFWDSRNRQKRQQEKESTMARMISIQDLLNMGVGEIIPGFRAKIAKVQNQRSGDGANGAWTMQLITLKDGTGLIEAKLWNRDNYTAKDIGSEFIFESTDTQKGLSGLKRALYESKGIETPQVEVNKAADISPVSGHAPAPTPIPPERPAPAPLYRVPAPASLRQQAPAPRQTAPQPAGDWSEVNAVLNRQINLRIRCEQAAIRVADIIHAETGYAMEPEEIERRATAFYIELNRKLVTAPDTLPRWKKPFAPSQPAPAPLPPSQMTEPPDDYASGVSPGELAAEGGEVDDVPF